MVEINSSYLSRPFFDASNQVKTEYKDAAANLTQAVDKKIAELHMPEAAKQELYSLLKAGAIDLAPSTDKSVNYDKAIDRLAKVALATTEFTEILIDSAELLATVMIQQAAAQRKNALEGRMIARENAKAELLNQADKLSKEGDALQNGAIATVVFAVVAAVFTVAASGLSIKANAAQVSKLSQTADELNEAKDQLSQVGKATTGAAKPAAQPAANETDKMMADLEKKLGAVEGKIDDLNFESIGARNMIIKEAGKLLDSFANASSTYAQGAAKKLESSGAVDAAQAQDQQQTADGFKEVQQSLDDFVKTLIGFLKELRDSKAELMQAFTRV